MRLHSGILPGPRAIPLDLDESSELFESNDQVFDSFDATTFGSRKPHTDWEGAAVAPIEQTKFVTKGGRGDAEYGR